MINGIKMIGGPEELLFWTGMLLDLLLVGLHKIIAGRISEG